MRMGNGNKVIDRIGNDGVADGTKLTIHSYDMTNCPGVTSPDAVGAPDINVGLISWKSVGWSTPSKWSDNGKYYIFGVRDNGGVNSQALYVYHLDGTNNDPGNKAVCYSLDARLPGADLALNPRDGKFYTIDKNGVLYSVTLSRLPSEVGAKTGTVATIKTLTWPYTPYAAAADSGGDNTLWDYGGLWMQANENVAYLFGAQNQGNKVIMVNLDSTNSANTKIIAYGDSGGLSAYNDGTSAPVEPDQADIILTKSANPSGKAAVGSTVVFTITAYNQGPNPANLQVVLDKIDAPYTLVSSSTSQGTYTSATGEWKAGQLAGGATATLTLTTTLSSAATTCVNTVELVSSSAYDPDTSNNRVSSSDPCGSTVITATKVTPSVNVSVGDLVPYTVTFTNGTSAVIPSIDLQDQVPPGFKYKTGSATLGGCSSTATMTASEPTVSGRQLTWSNQSFSANECKRARMLLVVGSGVGVGDYINQTWAEQNHVVMSNTASATVRVVPDPTFDCSDIIGKVFDDKNANGYHDQNEPGVANVRVVTVNGLLVKTDHEGRFHVACSDIPQAERGSNFIMKLDERSLPSGYRVTSENPRVVRTTRGKMTKLNFGAAIHRVVRVDLMDAAFETGKPEPTAALAEALKKLPETLKEKPSVVRLAYRVGQDGDDLARDRVQAIRQQVEKDWKDLECCYTLHFEEEFIEPAVAAKEGGK